MFVVLHVGSHLLLQLPVTCYFALLSYTIVPWELEVKWILSYINCIGHDVLSQQQKNLTKIEVGIICIMIWSWDNGDGVACGDLNMSPIILMHINTLSAVIGTVLRVLGGTSLREEVCHWARACVASKSISCSQLVLSISCGSRSVRSQPLVLSAMSVDGPTTTDPKPLELKVQNTLFCKSHLSWCLITELDKLLTYRDS